MLDIPFGTRQFLDIAEYFILREVEFAQLDVPVCRLLWILQYRSNGATHAPWGDCFHALVTRIKDGGGFCRLVEP